MALPRPDVEQLANSNYRWIALSNTTLGVLLATINSSIILISLPAIFRGIHIDPLAPGETSVFLWLIMGYMVVTATLVVTIGRISDMVGRVKMYNAGFAIFTVGSILLLITPGDGTAAAIQMIAYRIIQGVGGAFLFANSAAILTDAFPHNQRGLALGLNQIAAIAGSLLGLILGGILSVIDYRLVFLVSVPVGIAGTIWAYVALHEIATIQKGHRIDVLGNVTFAAGLTILLLGVTYGLLPYGSSPMGWGNPLVLGALVLGVLLLAAFLVIETRVADPMFNLGLFKRRAFAAGNLAGFLASISRGGLQFMLIIWLQGIWLPLHGYSYADTPLWAGIYMIPMLAGFMVMGPLSGFLSDRFGARAFSTVGMVVSAAAFLALTLLPANFPYPVFAIVIMFMGLGMGLFSSPNMASVMNSLPAEHRGAGSGMLATFQNAGMLISMGLFFTVVVVGLSSSLPNALYQGLTQNGLSGSVAQGISHLPPTAALFAAFLGYNPMATLLPHAVLAHLPASAQATLLGKEFFPNLISPPFMSGLRDAFYFGAALSLIAAVASALRGRPYIHGVTVAAAGSSRSTAATAMGGSNGHGAALTGSRNGAPFPDLLVAGPAAPQAQANGGSASGAVRPIVVAVDRSPAAAEATATAGQLATLIGCPVEVLHVLEAGVVETAAIDLEALDIARHSVKERIDQLTAAGISASGHILPSVSDHAATGRLIARYANQLHARAIVAGLPAQGPLAALMDASPDNELWNIARCHVLLATPGAGPLDPGRAGLEPGRRASAGAGRVAAACAISGTVRARGGAAVGMGVVTVAGPDGRQVGRVPVYADGTYALTELPPAVYTLIVSVAGYRPEAAMVTLHADRSATHDFVLTGTGSVHGIVSSDRGGAALAGATVQATDPAGQVVGTARTGPDGAYRLAELPEGTATVAANAPGHEAAARTVEVVSGRSETVNLTLAGIGEVYGTVRSPGGTALPGATVTATDAGGQVVARAVSGRDGSYRLSGLASGAYTLVASGYHPVVRKAGVSPGELATVDVAVGAGER